MYFFFQTVTGCDAGAAGTNNCCTASNLCGNGEGDCDSDAGCLGSLKCGSNNCDTSLGFGSTWDCCYDDGYTPEGINYIKGYAFS